MLSNAERKHIIQRLKEKGFKGSYTDVLRKFESGGSVLQPKDPQPVHLKESPYFGAMGGITDTTIVNGKKQFPQDKAISIQAYNQFASGGRIKSDYHRDGFDFHTMTTNYYKNGGKVENYDRTGGDDYPTYRGGSPDFGYSINVSNSNHPTGRYYENGKEVPRWYYFGGPVVINKKEKETYGQSTQRPIIANGGEFIDLPSENSDDAYIMEFPELRQVFNFDCGASALQAVLAYYGNDMREDKIMKMLDSRPTDEFNNGSKISAIIKVAKEFKLSAERIDGMKPEDLIDYIKQDIPVIVLLQAWRDDKSPKNWETDFSDGHYVVAVGYNSTDILFEDPSSYMRSYLSYDELGERWHSRDDDNKSKIYGTGIVVKGKPQFKEGAVSHMN